MPLKIEKIAENHRVVFDKYIQDQKHKMLEHYKSLNNFEQGIHTKSKDNYPKEVPHQEHP